VTLQLAAMVAIVLPLDDVGWNAAATWVVVSAIALGLWALTANRPGNFNIRPEPKTSGYLALGGPYRFVRHPMYVAVLLGTAGFCVGYATPWRWAVFVVLVVVLHLKTKVEEAALAALHPGYAEYAQRTKRLVPFVW
jgi:protein-S-isoprenylcysteine O-methyltransferase Ste14